MFQVLETSIIQAFSDHLKSIGIETNVGLEQPRQPEFGEFALPVAFQLARQLKQPPRAIAEQILAAVGSVAGVAKFEVAGNGYINVRLDREAFLSGVLAAGPEAAPRTGKIIVEHTNINPNKAAHIGHLRNAILGDTFVRMLRARGRTVEVQNYIDNTGVQVADVVVAFHHLERRTAADVAALAAQPRFDFLCWDLYAHISGYYAEHEEARAWRVETLHAIESGQGEVAELAHIVGDAIVGCHLRTMLRLGVVYDVLPRESEILHLKFWARAFEQLKEREAIYLETEGKNAGCWVMPGSAFRTGDTKDAEGEENSKVIVRSNGTVTYVGKDIAYQMWKFGLLGRDFFYKVWMTYDNGHRLYVSTDSADGAEPVKFGGGTSVYNVIDSRQSYLQDVVVAGLRALGYPQQADASTHFSYEMVALTPRTCVELGIELSDEDKRRPYVEVSGRKGLGVKADDLIDKLIDTAMVEVESRHTDKSAEANRAIAGRIAIGALRYFMLKFTRNSVIAFDFQEALSFEGETGPYVQYAGVRAQNILRKLGDTPDFSALTGGTCAPHLEDDRLWQFLLTCARAESVVESAIGSGEPAHVARYAFQLAQAFSNFYHDFPVIAEADPAKKLLLVWLTSYFLRQLQATLDVLGIPLPEYM